MKYAWLLVSIALAGSHSACGSFEDEDIVIDTRVLAMSASVPDQVIDIDLENPQPDAELLTMVVPSRMCALVADPGSSRRLRWTMTLCSLDNDERCYGPRAKIGEGIAEDPEESPDDKAIEMCAMINPDGNLIGVIRTAFDNDDFGGIAGVYYGVSMTVGGEDLDPSLDLYAGKSVSIGPRIPAERTPNVNPDLLRVDLAAEGADPVPLPLGRCVEQTTFVTVKAGTKSRITPIESETTRETYVVPTLDGSKQSFTEAPTYQWSAGAGGFSQGNTGGKRDIAGNPAPLFTDWRAPSTKDVGQGLDVPIWIVQRDERLGATWYETCVRVLP